MPGPGRKTKIKTKTQNAYTAGSTTTPAADAYVGDIDHADGWYMIVNILCEVFEIPDITTRSGLKNVHANFESIYRRLDKAYLKYGDNKKIAGGIVGIYAKMSADSLLMNKLFQRGLLAKLMPLLNIESTRHMALRALGTITHHGGQQIRLEIAKFSHVLTKLIEDFPDDKDVVELSITSLAHSVNAALEGEKPPDPKLLASLDMRTIVKVVTENTRKEWASPYLIDHAMTLLAMATLHASEACKGYPPMIKFLVAGLRSKDWVTRCTCLGGIIRLHRSEAELDEPTFDIHKYMACIRRGFPDHLIDLTMNYGLTRCDTYLTLQISKDYQQVMMACAQNKNLYILGLKTAEFILRTEFSVADGMFQSPNPTTGKMEIIDMGLPFTRWVDALPLCARAIRARGEVDKLDSADILDIKYKIMKCDIPGALEIARKGLIRNPECGYFYYAITLSVSHVDGLRAAKKGMKAKNITHFIRLQMMQRAVAHAADMGIRILQDSPAVGKAKWEEGIAFLMSALDDAETFVAQAPPDNRHMNYVLYWYVLLMITIRGPDMTVGLEELQGPLKASKIADDFSTAVDEIPPKTNLRLAKETVVRFYPAAVREFGNVIAKAASPSSDKPLSPEKLVDDLAAWLEATDIDGEHGCSEKTSLHPTINTNSVALYRCSWCRNPSAVLRKCSGCSKTRYCDAGCQKSHWVSHKKFCDSASTRPA